MSTMTQAAEAPEAHLRSTPPELPLVVADAPVPEYATPGYRGTDSAPDYLLPDLASEPRWYRNFWLAVAVIVVALFARVVFGYFAGADSGVDQNAYLVGGRLLAQHFSMRYTLPNPYAYSGGMFIRLPDGTYFPKYPFGLPLLFACFFWAFKIASVLPILKAHVEAAQAAYWAFIVSPVSAVAAVAGVFFLARQVSGSFAATLAAILLGTSQLMLMLADNPNSHASCLAFIVWGMFFCLRWMQTGSYWRGILGGLLVGYAATIRYNEILLFIPMCVVVLSRLPWNQWKTWLSVSLVAATAGAGYLIYANVSNFHAFGAGLEPRWTSGEIQLAILATTLLIIYTLAALVICVMKLEWPDWRMYIRALVPGLAWAVPVLILFAVNLKAMGSPTGYDSTHESEFGVAFQWQFFWRNWEKVFRDFYDMGLFFIVPFAVAGIFMLFRRSWRVSLLLLAWLVPGVVLYMSYYWSPDFADAYARFFLTYLPALLVGAAVCFHDGLLAGQRESGRWGGIALTISVGVVVAIAAGVSTYRTVHGLRDGAQEMRVPLNDFRQRLALAQTGQMLLDNVPEKSVLFADDAGGIATSANYIQFLRDWDLYSADAFSVQASRRGLGGPPRRNVNARGGGGGGGGGGRGNFNGPGGGPRGGGPGGFGGGGGGNFAANNNANNPNDPNAIATPVQPEQQLYHASLYRNKSSRQLYNLEAEVVNQAFAEHRRVFVLLSKEHNDEPQRTSGFSLFGGGENDIPDPMTSFKEDLNEAGKYKYKTVSRWEDVALPEDREEDLSLTDNSPMGGGRGGMGMNVARMFMGNDRIMDWQLVEVLPR